ncbi:MAG: DUF4386 domain-containing protein [Anaerolineae bacterium]|nr:DUF4386 domain-containing protein [Anaerolineae bacterium]MBT7188861.1 DUF4386 domain-containing protein [Anaerolineae bacterium]MBT7783526.1 DUF4386 domain-containing protein [Anaerolineae bacterium]
MNTQNKTYRKTAIIVGILYIIGTLSGILSLVFSDLSRNAENTLLQISANENQIIIAALFVLTMGLALVMVPVMMYPILKKHNPVLALGYVIFRGALEGATNILITISWLLLVPLSRAYVEFGAGDAALLEFFATTLFEGEEIGAMLNIVFSLGAAMFYTALFQAKLVPRWLSGWGLLSLISYFTAGLLGLFGVFGPLSSTSVAMQLPLALQEMVLAVWLISKGFNSVPEN